MPKVAFVTGVNGITGTAIADYLIENTAHDDFERIIVTSRSPMKVNRSDSRVEFISLDFLKSPEELATQMAATCSGVTHAYFASYVHKNDFSELLPANEGLFQNFISSLTKTSNVLANITLITGAKYYNVHSHPCPYPARESDPRLVDASENFYYGQEDALAQAQSGQPWSWNVIRPVGIIGATRAPNGMNHALTLALYFLVCAEQGVPAQMPTNQRHFNGVEDYSYAPLIADLAVFASTKLHCANQAFNIDNGDVFCWRHMWPRLAAYFGTDGTQQKFEKPEPAYGDGFQQEFTMVEWAVDKKGVWERLCEKAGKPEAKPTFDNGTWPMQDWPFRRTWSAVLSMNKAREFGWNGQIDTYESLVKTWEKMREFGYLP